MAVAGGGDGGRELEFYLVERLGVWRGGQSYRPMGLEYMTEDGRRRVTAVALVPLFRLCRSLDARSVGGVASCTWAAGRPDRVPRRG